MIQVRKIFLATAVAVSSLGMTAATASVLKLDESHTTISFKVPHLVISSVTGRFNKFEGTATVDEKKKTVDNIVVKIEADSIDTAVSDRDKHLKSKDFFDADEYPNLEFKSKKTVYKGGKPVKIEGDLTIRGVTKPVVLNVDYHGVVTDPQGHQRVGFEAKTKINRKDFGLTWNKTLDKGGVAVGDDVQIMITAEAIVEGEDKS